MSIVFQKPVVSYRVTHLDHTSHMYGVYEFYDNIQRDEFLSNMQCFNRYLTFHDGFQSPRKLDQTPCLIVQRVIEKKPFDNGAVLSEFFENLQDQTVYCRDKALLSYQGLIEPLRPDWQIFDRHMNLLYPDSDRAKRVDVRFGNAETIEKQILAVYGGAHYLQN